MRLALLTLTIALCHSVLYQSALAADCPKCWTPDTAATTNKFEKFAESVTHALPSIVLPPQRRVGKKYENTALTPRKGKTFCHVRDDAIVGIVIHHSATSNKLSEEELNEMHLATDFDMIGYHFTVSHRNNSIEVHEGRPRSIEGSHAGHKRRINIKDSDMLNLYQNENMLSCNHQHDDTNIVFNQKMDMNGARALANYTTKGIVVLGNYEPFSATNITGYDPASPPVVDSSIIQAVATTVCELKRQYKNLRYIYGHRDIQDTVCPGRILYPRIADIINAAKAMGCAVEDGGYQR